MTVHRKSKEKFVRTIKSITKRSNGKGFLWLKKRLTEYIRGWMGYYCMADMKAWLADIEKWYHRRLRSYIWKSWKRVGTRFKNLMKCGISRWQSLQWANSRKGYWRVADSPISHRAITNERLYKQGYPSLMWTYCRLHRN